MKPLISKYGTTLKMAQLTIGQIEKKYKLSKATLHRKMESGDISFTRNDKGDRVIDEAELHRVLGDTIRKRENEEIETGFKTGSWDPVKLEEFYDMKAKWKVAEARADLAEARSRDLEQDRNSWKEIAQRLSLPSPKTVPETVPETPKETVITLNGNSTTLPVTNNETKNDQALKPALKPDETVSGEGRGVSRNQSLLSKLFGKRVKK